MNATLADLDARIGRYRSAADTISANLLELEHDPNRLLLDQAPLRGATAEAWAEARAAIATTWEWYAGFGAFLDRATELRVSPRTRLAPGRERELAAFLEGPSIELRADDVPLADRDLLQERLATRRSTGDELLTMMAEAFRRAKDVVVAVGTVWDELLPRVTAVQGRVNRALPFDAGDAELVALDQRVGALTEALAVDPLSVLEPDVVALEHLVADLDQSLASANELAARLHEELRDARRLLETVDQTVADAAQAQHDARARVVLADDSAIPTARLRSRGRARADPPPRDRRSDPDGARRAALVPARRSTRWLDTADEMARVASARLREREQLRGRLDAYSAQAHAFGLDEDPAVTEAHDRAEAALFTAPTDLDAASELVFRYQQLVSDTSPHGRVPR